jgi:glycosyltransferase involved in cell wall biosynthesis
MALLINGRFLMRPVTGVERYGHGLLKAIAAEWPEARVLVPGRYEGPGHVSGLRVEPVGRGTGHAWEQLQLPRHVKAGDVLLSPANTGPLRCTRHVIVVHDLAFLRHPEWFNKRMALWYRMIVPRSYAKASAVITVSRTVRDQLLHYFGGDPSRLQVVPPYFDEAVFSGPEAGVKERPFCLIVGSMDRRKGLDDALSWYDSLEAPRFDLVMVGRRHRAFAPPELNIPAGVQVLHDVDDARLALYYRQALALISCSHEEGFGLPLLEAMAFGCPVIARRLQVFEEQFGDAVRYADLDLPADISQAVEELDTPAERHRRAEMGRAVAARFTIERTRLALRNALQPVMET